MLSTLLKVVLSGYNNLEFHKHEELNKQIEEATSKFEELKSSFPKDVDINKLLKAHKDVNGLETAKKLDNILLLGVKVGIELSTYLQKIDLK